MQLYALNQFGAYVYAQKASKQKDYTCTECAGLVRLRGGHFRQKHFFHLKPSPLCRQSGKSLIHLAIQNHFYNLFEPGTCQVERRFKEIKRIADVVWETEKIIFEIQCSPIEAEEVNQRNLNYKTLGYTVVWILHDKTFNKPFYSAAESMLRNSPFFFTNMNENGEGHFYDQFDLFDKGMRKFCSLSIPINLKNSTSISALMVSNESEWPKFIQNRLKNWPIYFENDLVSVAAASQANPNPLFKYMLESEEALEALYQKPGFFKHCANLIKNLYLSIFNLLLEKACR